jgi:hypothetical protein
MRYRSLPVLALLCVVCAQLTVAPAQAAEALGHRGFFELGQLSATDEGSLTQVGMRFASLTPNRPSLDIALAGWGGGGLVVVPDIDVAVPIALGPNLRLIPRAGASMLLVSGGSFIGGAVGTNVGAGLVLDLDSALSLRADAVARRYVGEELADDNPFMSFTVGIGWRAGGSTPSITSAR